MSQAILEQERQARLKIQLDDDAFFYGTICGLNIEDKGDGFPFRDVRDQESAYAYADRFLDAPPDGKARGVFAPRGMGKSISIAMPRVVRAILRDPSITVALMGENATETVKRSLWVRTRLELAQSEHGYGPIVCSDRWAKEAWSVIRPGGIGGQDTVTVGSPDRPGTSQHWRYGIFDDAVGQETAESAALMLAGIKWFRETYLQAMMGSRVELFGTLWPGNNIYRCIIQEIEGGLARMDREDYGPGVVYRGKQFDLLVLTPEDRRTGKILFCGWDKDYLAAKRKIIGDAMYRAQMQQILLLNEELGFNDDWFGRPEPVPDKPMRIFVLTDTATSTGRVRHTSISAVLVVGKTADNHAYLLDAVAGKLGWDRVPDAVIDMAIKWKPERIIRENTGPSATLNTAVRDRGNLREAEEKAAALAEKRKFKPQFNMPLGDWVASKMHAVGRTSDKHFRIQTIIPHAQQGRFHVCDTCPPHIYRVDDAGQLKGLLGEQIVNYTFGADESYDILDAAGDIWGYDGFGNTIFTPPRIVVEERISLRDNPWQYLERHFSRYNKIDEDAAS